MLTLFDASCLPLLFGIDGALLFLCHLQKEYCAVAVKFYTVQRVSTNDMRDQFSSGQFFSLDCLAFTNYAFCNLQFSHSTFEENATSTVSYDSLFANLHNTAAVLCDSFVGNTATALSINMNMNKSLCHRCIVAAGKMLHK